MLHAKSQGHQPSGSGEDLYSVFTIYGHGRHLGDVTRTICTNFGPPILRSLHMNSSLIGPVVSVKKKFENVDGQQTTNPGQTTHATVIVGILLAHI